MTHTEYAEGLRELADFLEAHPEIELPEATLNNFSLTNKEKFADTARAMAKVGRCNKEFAESVVTLSVSFGPILLRYHGMRYNVCEQVKVGTRVVPERYVPPQPATVGQTIPEHEETVYEWRCSPLLGKPEVEVPEEKALTAGTPMLEAEYVDLPF